MNQELQTHDIKPIVHELQATSDVEDVKGCITSAAEVGGQEITWAGDHFSVPSRSRTLKFFPLAGSVVQLGQVYIAVDRPGGDGEGIPLCSLLRLILLGSDNPPEAGSTAREFEKTWEDFARAHLPWQRVDLDQHFHAIRLDHEPAGHFRVTPSVEDVVRTLKPGTAFYVADVRARNSHQANMMFRDLPSTAWQSKKIRNVEVIDAEPSPISG